MNISQEQIIFKGLAGSRLYGTHHDGSDWDYKIVFAHTLDGLIRGDSDTDRTKDDEDNTESEFFSLKKFSQLLGQNQTVAIELLFMPTANVIYTTPAWDEVVAMRHLIVSKNLMPFIGYARNQARIYSTKGDRLGFLRKMKGFVEAYFVDKETCENATVQLQMHAMSPQSFVAEGLKENFLGFEMKKTPNGRDVKQVNILGKGFEEFASPKTWIDRIQIQIEKYGERAQLAEVNTGHDVKATYHAVRVVEEAIELLITGKLAFPRKEVKTLLEIRAGQYDYNTTCQMIQERVELLERLIPRSLLRDSADRDALNKWYQTWQRVAVCREIGV